MLSIILPVGISFYTLQALSYTIDLYKRETSPAKNILSFFAFTSFFPQLLAGPIEKSSHLLNQFESNKIFNYTFCVTGLRLILWGLFKKIVIADNFGVLADHIFNSESSVPGISIIIGSIFFAFQIYGDFSGYSDIAIGLSRMLGFDLIKNFQTPYFANSFTDFWRRWHISLSIWFRDYVYIPLGGNKKSTFRVYFNIFLTFLLSGLWHGANITFLIWGSLHGISLIIEKIFKQENKRNLHTLVFLILVILFWIPFRAKNYSHLTIMVNSIIDLKSYTFYHLNSTIQSFSIIRFTSLIIITISFLYIEKSINIDDFNEWIQCKRTWVRFSIYYILILTILAIGNFTVKPTFIYFQF